MKCTVADFIVKYIDNQYVEVDGVENKFVEGVFAIFGHGNVLGLGQSLEFEEHDLNVIQGKSEQGMAHSAIGFSKQRNRHAIYAVTTSIGPGCTNLVTAAATATVNKIPLLLFPGDTFENRQSDAVLQQVEQNYSASVTATNALYPVSKYYDRVTQGESIYSILQKAFSVLTCPEKTGTVTIALPQDVQAQIINVDERLLEKQVWTIKRRLPSQMEIEIIKKEITRHQKIAIVCGGGVKYSLAGRQLQELSTKLNIPIVETQAGKSAIIEGEMNLGGIGVTGTQCANQAVNDASLIIALGTRLNDFTSQSASMFLEKTVINVNLNNHDGIKQNGIWINADVKLVLEELLLSSLSAKSIFWKPYIQEWKNIIRQITDSADNGINLNQSQVVIALNRMIETDAIIICASGSLPADLERLWVSKSQGGYHMEYGYSCMGYEINSAIGVKLAEPHRPVYVFCGDGSFNMLHSELLTSIQYQIPINIILFDNSGFGCINNLQIEYGSNGYRTEFNKVENNLETGCTAVDYAQIARGYGAEGIKINTMHELKKIKDIGSTVLYDLKVDRKSMTEGYLSWWDVGFNRVNKTPSQIEMLQKLNIEREKRNGITIDRK